MMLELINKSININEIKRIDYNGESCIITWVDGNIEVFQGEDAEKIKELSPENFMFRRIDFVVLMLALKAAIQNPGQLVNKSQNEIMSFLINYTNNLEINPEQAQQLLSDYKTIMETKMFQLANQELIGLLEVIL